MSDERGSVAYREATADDVPAMVRCRAEDPLGPADARMALYLERKHHPQRALGPRVMFACLEGEAVVGYIGGHLTTRFECDGELQYLYVVPEHRRTGVATNLFDMLARWFEERRARRVCVDVEPDNHGARAFYARSGAVRLSEYWLVWEDVTTGL